MKKPVIILIVCIIFFVLLFMLIGKKKSQQYFFPYPNGVANIDTEYIDTPVGNIVNIPGSPLSAIVTEENSKEDSKEDSIRLYAAIDDALPNTRYNEVNRPVIFVRHDSTIFSYLVRLIFAKYDDVTASKMLLNALDDTTKVTSNKKGNKSSLKKRK